MTPAEEKRIFTRAIAVVAGPLQQAVKSHTPVGPTGNLKRSIAKVVKVYGGGKLAIGFVGPNWWNSGRHGHLVEEGTKMRYTKAGAYRGAAPAKPFLGPVFEANKSSLSEALGRQVWSQLEAWWRK